MMEVGFDRPAPLDELRASVNHLNLGETSLQQFGKANTVAIRLPLPKSEDEAAVQRVVAKVESTIKAEHPDAKFRRVETVSGKVSGELIRDGALAALIAMGAVALYIWFRFEWQFGVGALFSLFHDVTITLGFFSLTRLEFNLNVVAAILTIIGYSLNDTIVVYDRVRENLRKYRKMDIEPLLDLTVNEMLARTMVTSLSMIIALSSLVFLGGEVIFGFSVAMLLGIFIGTYSSIYVAAPILIWLGVGPATFVPEAEPKGERVAAAQGLMPELVQQPGPAGVPVVQGYATGGWRVSGQLWPGGVLVTPVGVEALAALSDLAGMALDGVEVLLLGTGMTMVRPDPALLAALPVPVEYMDSKAAARTYNVLAAEGRRVAAALPPLAD